MEVRRGLAFPVQDRFSLAFEVPGYLWLWLNALFTAATFTVETLSQGWLMLLLTNSPFWVGLAAGIRGASQAMFSVPVGSLADRFDRRKILIVTQSTGALATLTRSKLYEKPLQADEPPPQLSAVAIGRHAAWLCGR